MSRPRSSASSLLAPSRPARHSASSADKGGGAWRRSASSASRRCRPSTSGPFTSCRESTRASSVRNSSHCARRPSATVDCSASSAVSVVCASLRSPSCAGTSRTSFNSASMWRMSEASKPGRPSSISACAFCSCSSRAASPFSSDHDEHPEASRSSCRRSAASARSSARSSCCSACASRPSSQPPASGDSESRAMPRLFGAGNR
mmetsp:Transcript_103752/g.334513  ORF Transcript_103752/g.334513 Transcript_103752/m.334513 type:complete len:204 (-) Transcript_103752:39-650(-)